jgi:hypothetical protein
MHRTSRFAAAAAAAVLTSAVGLSPAAHAVEPTPDQASFKVKRAECGYAPTADKIKAWANIRVIVKQLPEDETYYTLGKVVSQSRKPGTTAWKTFAAQGVTSIGFGTDRLPYAWNAKSSKPVPPSIANTHEVSFKYVIKLMESTDAVGSDDVVWKAKGRSATVGCGDG